MPAAAQHSCWILTDGAAGNERQAQALADALRCRAEVIGLALRAPWSWFAPRLLPGAGHAFGPGFTARMSQPPELAIACGRRGALAARILSGAGGGHCRTIQILDPRIAPAHFDLVIAPAHDRLSGDNVIRTVGALNPIDGEWLARARVEFAGVGTLERPITLLALGGPTRSLRLDRGYFEQVAAILEHWHARDGGSVLVTSSRRTPAWLRAGARRRLAGLPGRQWHGAADGPNPYAGFLAWADRIVVTPDSVNLLSEACATGRPVLCHAPRPPRGKIGDLYRALVESGRVRALHLEYQPWQTEPLRELGPVAEQVRVRLGL